LLQQPANALGEKLLIHHYISRLDRYLKVDVCS
jgi:hypothetical protein